MPIFTHTCCRENVTNCRIASSRADIRLSEKHLKQQGITGLPNIQSPSKDPVMRDEIQRAGNVTGRCSKQE